MLLLSLDFETSGLDRNSDRVIEVGAILYSTTQGQQLMTQGYLVDHEIPVSAEITEVTGIKKGMIDKFGLSSKTALSTLLNMVDMCEAIVGKNLLNFDMLFLENWVLREKEILVPRLVIDIETDLPGVKSEKLSYTAANHGFLNLFPHSAVADCQTVLKLVSMHNLDEIVARAKSPRVTIAADVDYDTNHLAKKRGYRWQPEQKTWYKVIKEMDLDTEVKAAQFNVKRIAPIDVYFDSRARLVQ